jgi:hypothetical protein
METEKFDAWYRSMGEGLYRVIYYSPNTTYQGPLPFQMIRDEYVVDNEMEAKEDCRLLNALDVMYNGTQKHHYKVGDDVSYGFNGDWYYAGKIASFTKSGKFFTTDHGIKFTMKVIDDETCFFHGEKLEVYKIKREIFKRTGTCFTAAHGKIEERNPHF